MAYLGNHPGVASQRVVTTFTATAGQTTFTPQSGYTLGYLDVYHNGVRLVNGDDYTAANGVNFVLAEGAAVGDVVEAVAYIPRGLSDGYLKSEADARYQPKATGTPDGSKFLRDDGTWQTVDTEVTSSDVTGALGYTPVNKAGDTMTGGLTVPLLSFPRKTWSPIINFGTTNKDIQFYSEAFNITDTFSIYNLTDNRELIRWDSSGRVMMPFQPAFYARGGIQVAASQNLVLPFNEALTNKGSHFNTSNHRFTAPVAGMYMLTTRITWSSTGTGSALFICVNGSPFGGNSVNTELFGYNSVGGYHTTSAVTALVAMNAGDFADVRATVYNSSPQNVDMSRCSFGGCLLS